MLFFFLPGAGVVFGDLRSVLRLPGEITRHT